MVLQVPAREISLLLVFRNRNEGNLLRMGLEDSMGKLISRIDVEFDPKSAFNAYKQKHPDVVIICGFETGYSEALIINIRKIDGKRHTGILVMAPVDQGYDLLAVNNFHAGADDVLSSNLSMAILKSKIITVFNYKLAADELRTLVHELAARNLTDELTGLANMRGFLKSFGASLKECQNGKFGVAVVMMDLDNFKRINDKMNHMVGSYIIKSVGKVLSSNNVFEAGDFAARYGGDEYIIVLHGLDPKKQMSKADAVRKIIEAKEFVFQDYKVRVTCSLGMCFVPPGFLGKPEDIVKGADMMLYKSKDAGRNSTTGMVLRYPIDFNHIGRSHLIDVNPDLSPELVNQRAGNYSSN